jgi:hypothetical protein
MGCKNKEAASGRLFHGAQDTRTQVFTQVIRVIKGATGFSVAPAHHVATGFRNPHHRIHFETRQETIDM